MPTKIQPKAPSKKFKEAIHNVIGGFVKINDALVKAFDIGRAEGFTDMKIGEMIKMEMLEAGFHKDHITRMLPDTAKRKYKRYHHGKRDKLSDYQDLVTTEEDDAPTGKYEMDANEYDIDAVEQYDRLYLVNVVKYLHKELWDATLKWDKKIHEQALEIEKLKKELAKKK